MPDRLYRRLRNCAAFSVGQFLATLVICIGDVQSTYAVVALLVVSLPLFWSWGAYQAEVALNSRFRDRDRARWRVVLVCLPGSMAVYWYRHIRVSASDRLR